jgi:acetoin utilization deacetylase AcuC-like enzyme
MQIFFSSECLEYKQHAHPENPGRVRSTYEYLQDKFSFKKASMCKEKDLALVHSENLIESVKSGKFFDQDSPRLEKIHDYARLSAGSALHAMEFSWKNKENTFSLMRPPGHHAGKNFLGGFCYFNSIAIAVENIMAKVDKVAIVDIDGHHGNGTQDIFFGRDDVIFISLHQKNAYPMTGFTSEKNCFNFPLDPGTKRKEYMEIFENALRYVKNFNPDLIAVSSGFDTFQKDPLLEIDLEIGTFFEISTSMRKLGKPVCSVLEGGYSPELNRCIRNYLDGLDD